MASEFQYLIDYAEQLCKIPYQDRSADYLLWIEKLQAAIGYAETKEEETQIREAITKLKSQRSACNELYFPGSSATDL